MKIKPLFDRIVIEQCNAKDETSGGILLPSSSQEKPQMGKVVYIPEKENCLPETKIFVKEGDLIFYSKFSGIEYKFNNRILTIIRQADILAILEE